MNAILILYKLWIHICYLFPNWNLFGNSLIETNQFEQSIHRSRRLVNGFPPRTKYPSIAGGGKENKSIVFLISLLFSCCLQVGAVNLKRATVINDPRQEGVAAPTLVWRNGFPKIPTTEKAGDEEEGGTLKGIGDLLWPLGHP